MSNDDEYVVQRLLMAIQSTRTEKALARLATMCWRVSEKGLFGLLGDRFSDAEHAVLKLRWRRAGIPKPTKKEG